jgi:hypothetical protein
VFENTAAAFDFDSSSLKKELFKLSIPEDKKGE